MHHALCVPEIVHEILSNLCGYRHHDDLKPEFIFDHDRIEDWLEDTSDDRLTLLNISKSCRALSAVALDQLWMVMFSLEPFFQLFSSFKPTADHDEDIPEPRCLIGDISYADWSAFDRYARRVRVFRMRLPEENQETHFNATLMRLHLSRNVPLFPTLSHLEFEGGLPLYAPLLLSLFLDTLSFDIPEDRMTTGSEIVFGLLNALPVPHFKHLSLAEKYWEEYAADCGLYVKVVGCLTRLQSLRLMCYGPACPRALQTFSMLADLRHLDFHIYPGSNIPRDLETAVHKFPSLRKVRLSGQILDLQWLYSSMQILSSVQSFHLTVVPTNWNDSNNFVDQVITDMKRDMDILNSQLSVLSRLYSRTLTSVVIQGRFMESPWSQQDAIQCLQLLKPLLQISGLQHLGVSLYQRDFVLSDEEILTMASSWPYLTSFHLSSIPYSEEHRVGPRPSLLALHSLASFCPKLEVVTLIVPTHASDLCVDLPPAQCPLVSALDVGWSNIRSQKDVPYVARFLHRIFPSLERVRFSSKSPRNNRAVGDGE